MRVLLHQVMIAERQPHKSTIEIMLLIRFLVVVLLSSKISQILIMLTVMKVAISLLISAQIWVLQLFLQFRKQE